MFECCCLLVVFISLLFFLVFSNRLYRTYYWYLAFLVSTEHSRRHIVSNICTVKTMFNSMFEIFLLHSTDYNPHQHAMYRIVSLIIVSSLLYCNQCVLSNFIFHRFHQNSFSSDTNVKYNSPEHVNRILKISIKYNDHKGHLYTESMQPVHLKQMINILNQQKKTFCSHLYGSFQFSFLGKIYKIV